MLEYLASAWRALSSANGPIAAWTVAFGSQASATNKRSLDGVFGWMVEFFYQVCFLLGIVGTKSNCKKRSPNPSTEPTGQNHHPPGHGDGFKGCHLYLGNYLFNHLNVLLKYVVYLSSNETKKKGLEENPKWGKSFSDRIRVAPSYILVVLIEATS